MPQIAREHFVIDADIVLLAFTPKNAVQLGSEANVLAAQQFLSRAQLENAVLHVPELFLELRGSVNIKLKN